MRRGDGRTTADVGPSGSVRRLAAVNAGVHLPFVARRPRLVAGVVVFCLVPLVGGCAGSSGEGTGTEDAPSHSASMPGHGQHSHDKGHEHGLHEVPASQAPTVRLRAVKDSVDGWNLHLTTSRFRFAPEHAGGRAVRGEGHAHLYLDGTKIARIYGPWYHLAADAVPPGTHTLAVDLTTNGHDVYAVDGKKVTATATVSSGSSAGDNATPADRTIRVAVADGRATPAVHREQVELGERVRIEVTTDRADTVHLHGYDKEAAARPGQPAVIVFTANQNGVFDVETHDPPTVLLQLQVS
jgi:hypothetical protein